MNQTILIFYNDDCYEVTFSSAREIVRIIRFRHSSNDMGHLVEHADLPVPLQEEIDRTINDVLNADMPDDERLI